MPDSEKLIFATCNTEPRTDNETANGCLLMQFIDLFEFMGGIVYLEKKSILCTNIDSSDLGSLFEWVRVIIEVFEVKDCEESISCMVVEDYWSAW